MTTTNLYTTKTAALKATKADVSKLNVKTIKVNGKDVATSVKHPEDTRTFVTEDDQWGTYAEIKNGEIVFHNDYIRPNLSNVSCHDAIVGEVLHGYNKDEEIQVSPAPQHSNIQTSRIQNGDYLFKDDKQLQVFQSSLKNLKSAVEMFSNCERLYDFGADMCSLENGNYMFSNCDNLLGYERTNAGTGANFSSDMPSLKTARGMFSNCTQISDFTSDLSSLEDGTEMFSGCSGLYTFTSELPSLKKANFMFSDCECFGKAPMDGTSGHVAYFPHYLGSLEDGDYMFGYTGNIYITSIDSDLHSLKTGVRMFSYFTALTSFTADLSSLTNGWAMFLDCNNLTTFTSDLSSLTDGSEMFSSCTNLTTFTSDLSSLTNGYDMFDSCKLDSNSIQNIVDFLPTHESNHTITIGINVYEPTAFYGLDIFAQDCLCSSWDELNAEFTAKNWTVQWQYNGDEGADIPLFPVKPDTYSLRSPEQHSVFVKLTEVIIPTDEKAHKPRYSYTSADGSKFYNLSWYHESNSTNDDYMQFNSIEEAVQHFGLKSAE